jgi:hypothetical protein
MAFLGLIAVKVATEVNRRYMVRGRQVSRWLCGDELMISRCVIIYRAKL